MVIKSFSQNKLETSKQFRHRTMMSVKKIHSFQPQMVVNDLERGGLIEKS